MRPHSTHSAVQCAKIDNSMFLHFFLPQSVSYPKKRYRTFLCTFLCIFLCAPSLSIEQGAPQYSRFLFISVLSSPSGCLHLCGISSTHLLSFTHTCSCILTVASVLLCNPSAAALSQSQFCPRSTRRKSNRPDFPKTCLVLGRLSLCLSFFSFSSSSLCAARKLAILSFNFFHQLLLLYFTFFFFLICFFFVFFLFHFFSFRFF